MGHTGLRPLCTYTVSPLCIYTVTPHPLFASPRACSAEITSCTFRVLKRRATLRGLGWTSFPSVSELTGHILDRLEYDWALRLPEEAHHYAPPFAFRGAPRGHTHARACARVGVHVDLDGGDDFFDPYDPELPEYDTLI